jgi:hypothetical protein
MAATDLKVSDDELNRLKNKYPGWHIWLSQARRWWATRRGHISPSCNRDSRWSMTIDADTSNDLDVRLEEQSLLNLPLAGKPPVNSCTHAGCIMKRRDILIRRWERSTWWKGAALMCICGGVESVATSPVITGRGWVDDHDPADCSPRSITMRIKLPVSAELMAAALYFEGQDHHSDDLAPRQRARVGRAALIIAQDGLNAVEVHKRAIRDLQQHDMIRVPKWLALCRQRVSEATRAVIRAQRL